MRVARSKVMFESFLEWCKKVGLDAILSEVVDPAVEEVLDRAFCPKVLKGMDKRGRPILYCKMGTIDLPALLAEGVTMDQLVRRHLRSVEALQKKVEAARDPLQGHLSIVDIATCTPKKFLSGWRFWLQQAKIGQNYYPELLGGTAVIRGPAAAEWAVRMIKKVMDKKTADKISLWGAKTDPRKPLSDLLDEDVLAEIEGDLRLEEQGRACAYLQTATV